MEGEKEGGGRREGRGEMEEGGRGGMGGGGGGDEKERKLTVNKSTEVLNTQLCRVPQKKSE